MKNQNPDTNIPSPEDELYLPKDLVPLGEVSCATMLARLNHALNGLLTDANEPLDSFRMRLITHTEKFFAANGFPCAAEKLPHRQNAICVHFGAENEDWRAFTYTFTRTKSDSIPGHVLWSYVELAPENSCFTAAFWGRLPFADIAGEDSTAMIKNEIRTVAPYCSLSKSALALADADPIGALEEPYERLATDLGVLNSALSVIKKKKHSERLSPESLLPYARTNAEKSAVKWLMNAARSIGLDVGRDSVREIRSWILWHYLRTGSMLVSNGVEL